MARSGSRRHAAGTVDLTATLERLAVRLGDEIGAGIARALGSAPAAQEATQRRKKRCAHEGCDRDAAAKGLCKSHYNLMLYHRRKKERSAGAGRRRS
ncbi:hypothetical protein [Vulgatibacter sp.]|uniref:hypothetical protein n=1 Tax=Vulgatibacter sp. TaxID=1971226 RepID=UPI00356A9DA2